MIDLKLLGTSDNKTYGNFNDLNYSNGDLLAIENQPRLQQSLSKILLTQTGENTFFPNYGSPLQGMVNERLNDPSMQADIVNAIIYGFTYWNEVDITTVLTEKVATINDISVKTNPNDPRQVNIVIKVTNQNNQILVITLGG